MAWWFYVTSPLQCLFWFLRLFAPKKPEDSRQRLLQNIRPTGEVDGSYRTASETSCKDDKMRYNAVGKDFTNTISESHETHSQEQELITKSEEYKLNATSSIIAKEPIQLHSNDNIIVNDHSDIDHTSQEKSIMNQINFYQNSSQKETTGFSNLREQDEDYVARSSVGFGKLELISRMLTEQIASEDREGNQTDIHTDYCSSGFNENISEPVPVRPEKDFCHHKDLIKNTVIEDPNTGVKFVGAIMKKSGNTLTMEDTEAPNSQMEIIEVDIYDKLNLTQRIEPTVNSTCENSEAAFAKRKISANEEGIYSLSLSEQTETDDKTRTGPLHENMMNSNNDTFKQSYSLETEVMNAISTGKEELLRSVIPDSTVSIVNKDDFTETPALNDVVASESTIKIELPISPLDAFAIEDFHFEIPIFEDSRNKLEQREKSILEGHEIDLNKTRESCDNETYDSESTDSDSTCKFSDSEKEIELYSHNNVPANEKFIRFVNNAVQASGSYPETHNELGESDVKISLDHTTGDKIESNSTYDDYDNDDEERYEGNITTDDKNYRKDNKMNSEFVCDQEYDKKKSFGGNKYKIDEKLKSNSVTEGNRNEKNMAYEENVTTDDQMYEKDDKLKSNPASEVHKNDKDMSHEGNETNDDKKQKNDEKLESYYNSEKVYEDNETTSDKNIKQNYNLERNSSFDVHENDVEELCDINVTIDDKNYKTNYILESNSLSDVHDKEKPFDGNVATDNKIYSKDEKLESNFVVDVHKNDIKKSCDNNVTIDDKYYETDYKLESNSSSFINNNEVLFADNVTTVNKNEELERNSAFDVHKNNIEKSYDINVKELIINDKYFETDYKLKSNSSSDVHDKKKPFDDNVATDNKNYEKDEKLESNSTFHVHKNDIEESCDKTFAIYDKHYETDYKLESNSSSVAHDKKKKFDDKVTINDKNYEEDEKLNAYDDNTTSNDKNYENDDKFKSDLTFVVQNNKKDETEQEPNEIKLNNSNEKGLISENLEILYCNLNSQTKEVAFDDSVTINSVFESTNMPHQNDGPVEKLVDFTSHEKYEKVFDAKSELKENEFNVSSTTFSCKLIQIKFDKYHKQEFRKLEHDLSEINKDRESTTLFNVKDMNFDKVASETKKTDLVKKISSSDIKSELLAPPAQENHIIETDETNEIMDNRSILLDSLENVLHANDNMKGKKVVNEDFVNLKTDTQEYEIEEVRKHDSVVKSMNKEQDSYLTSENPNNMCDLNHPEATELTISESSKSIKNESELESKQQSVVDHLSSLVKLSELEEMLIESLPNSSEKVTNTASGNETKEQASKIFNCINEINKSGEDANTICNAVTEKIDEVDQKDSSLEVILQNDLQQDNVLDSNINLEIVTLGHDAQELVIQDVELNKCKDLSQENDLNVQGMDKFKKKPEIKDQTIEVVDLMLEATLISDTSSKMEKQKERELSGNETKIDADAFSCNDSQNEFPTSVKRRSVSENYEYLQENENVTTAKSHHGFTDDEEPMDYECLHKDSLDSRFTEENFKTPEDCVIEEFLNKIELLHSSEIDMPLRRRNNYSTLEIECETNSKDKRRGMMNPLYNEEKMEVDEILIEGQTRLQQYDDVQEATISLVNREKRIGNVLFSSIEIRKGSLDEPILLEDPELIADSKNKRQGIIRLSSSEEFQSFDEFLLSDKDQIAMEKKIKFSKKGEIQRPIEKTPPFDFTNQKFFSSTTKNTDVKLYDQPSASEMINHKTRSESTNESQDKKHDCSLPLVQPSCTKETSENDFPMPTLAQNFEIKNFEKSVELSSTTTVPSTELGYKPGLPQITDTLQDTEFLDSAPPANEVHRTVNKKPVGRVPLFGLESKHTFVKHEGHTKKPDEGITLFGLGDEPTKDAPLFTLPHKTAKEQESESSESVQHTFDKHEVRTKIPVGGVPLFGLGHIPVARIPMFTIPQKKDTQKDTKCHDSAESISVEVASVCKKPVGGVPLFGLGHRPVGGVPMFALPKQTSSDINSECLDSAPSHSVEVESVCKKPVGEVSLFGLGHKPVGAAPMFELPKQTSTDNHLQCLDSPSANIAKVESASRKPVGGVPLFALGHKPLLNFEDKKIPVGGVKLFGGSELTEKLKGRREKLKEDITSVASPITSSLLDSEMGFGLSTKDALSKHSSDEPQCSISPKRKPFGGVSLFGGNEFQEKLKARRGKLPSEDNNTPPQLNDSTNIENQNGDDTYFNLTSDDKSVENFFQRFDSINKTTNNAYQDTELSLGELDQEKNILEHVNKSRPKGPLNRRPKQTNSRKEGKHR